MPAAIPPACWPPSWPWPRLLVGLRAAGIAAGWGFQFTAPAFVAALAWLMFAVGLNLSGVYSIGRPGRRRRGAGRARRPCRAASSPAALAVLVATPCTAPFMAAAVGAALALPAPATLAVFAALGLGLAAPYALLGLFPGPGAAPAAAGRLDGVAAPGPRLPDVCRRRLAGLGAGAAGRAGRAVCWCWPARCCSASPAGRSAWRSAAPGAGASPAAAWPAIAAIAALALLPALAAAPPAARAEAGAEPWSAARRRRAAGRGPPGLRQPDRRLVHHLQGERATGPADRAGPGRLRRPQPRLPEGRLDQWRRRHRRPAARARAGGRAAVPGVPGRRRRRRRCCRRC